MFNNSGFSFTGETITGLVRKQNEDSFLIAAPRERRTALAVVADGVGGHRHGEIVSYISCRDLGAAFKQTSDEELMEGDNAEKFLLQQITEINHRVYRINFEEFTLHPMSSTLVAVLFIPGFAVMANVGDSRFYAAGQDGALKQISTDHTLANETVYLEYKEKFGAKAANTISRSIGARYNLKTEIKRISVSEGERFLLCSDGVYRELSDENLQTILFASNSSRQAVNRIMRHVLLKGAHDNSTVVTVFPGKEAF